MKHQSITGPDDRVRTVRGHLHVEAFCLMLYVSDDNKESEVLWNSRDGVTPFCIHNRDRTKMLTHHDWRKDHYAPRHQPGPGDRIFVDLTPERAREIAQRQVDFAWDHHEHPLSVHFVTRDAAIEDAVKRMLEREGAPDIIVVPPAPAGE